MTYYAKTDGYFSSSRSKGDISTPANAGVYTLEIGTSPDQNAGAGANYFIDGESVGQTGGGREGGQRGPHLGQLGRLLALVALACLFIPHP